ncbi:MAG: Asp-tRNA(Asn)/Glu-tRNA(Gln) amidotransferase subunit GatB [Patescibacteria group bacterium]
MTKYQPTIGLEIHVELKTKTKMFCDCLNEPLKKEPNVNICPICTGQPGSLPVINKEAVNSVIKTGLALNCQIAEKSWFERKNYFYPDLPKGYQISQYEAPLCRNGYLDINSKKIKIRRIHLEEDTGKLLHDQGKDFSLVDFNRAGIPLMELVTEPDITSAMEARKFAQELQLILRYLGISDADMEKGQMRVEANVSLDMGTKVEIKNLNSFRSVERAIDYEIGRQREILEKGEKVIHETRGWNDTKQQTFSQRTKEEAEDYRYFPEPDLPPLKISSEEIEKLGDIVPELPAARRERFKKEYKIPDSTIDALITFKNLGDFFESTASELDAWFKSGKIKTDLDKLIKLSANYIMTEFPKYITAAGEVKMTPENFAELIYLTFIGEISSSGAQEVLKEMFVSGKDPSQIIESRKLKQVSDEEELQIAVETVIKNNPQAIEDYKKGKESSLQFLIGQVMRETRGQANPRIVGKIFKKKFRK